MPKNLSAENFFPPKFCPIRNSGLLEYTHRDSTFLDFRDQTSGCLVDAFEFPEYGRVKPALNFLVDALENLFKFCYKQGRGGGTYTNFLKNFCLFAGFRFQILSSNI